MVFYLFLPRASLNGIPLSSSAQYHLWIQPRLRRSPRTMGHPQTQTQQVPRAQVAVGQPSC